MQKIIKRGFDVVVSFLVIIIFMPVWLIIALAVKLTSPGPIFFLQERPGWHGKPFWIFKFRTMKPGSEQMIRGQEVWVNDPRITAVGKLLRRSKLDEVPQMLNVLKGEMSLVGPRPERMDYLNEYNERTIKRLHMRPGLTGLTQVSGGIYLPLEVRHELDVEYVEQFSCMLDLKILFRTAGVVLMGESKFCNKRIAGLQTTAKESASEKVLEPIVMDN